MDGRGATLPRYAGRERRSRGAGLTSCPYARPARVETTAQLVPAGQVLRGRWIRLRGEPVRVRGLRRAVLDAPPPGGDVRVRRSGRKQLLVEPPLDVRRRWRTR